MRLGLSLATVGVAVSVAVVAVGAHYVLGLPWELAVLLGAVTSPTDAAAVFSVLRVVPLPRRLTGALEAESGLNDAPTVVLVTLISTGASPSTASLAHGGHDRLRAGRGVAVGLRRRLRRRLADAPGRAAVVGPLPDRGADARLPRATARRRRARSRLRRGVRRRARARQHRAAAPRRHPVVRRGRRLAGPDRAVRDARAAALARADHVGTVGHGRRRRAGPHSSPGRVSVLVSAVVPPMPWRELAFLSWAGLRGAVPIVLDDDPAGRGGRRVGAALRHRVRDGGGLHAAHRTDAAAGRPAARGRRGGPSRATSRSRRRRWSGSPPTCCRSRSARAPGCTGSRSASCGCPRVRRCPW